MVFQGNLNEYHWKIGKETPVPHPVYHGEIPVLEFDSFAKTGIVIQAFTTRLGGVSEDCWTSMNLSFTRKDNPEHVKENHRLLAAALGYDWKKSVLSYQTHTDNIYVVTEEDAGKGISRERGFTGIDGLMTNVPGIPLITYYADCVPLMFADPVKKAIACVHSGWRGTVQKIGPQCISKMKAVYGSDPSDILAAIGPSICGDCYQVGVEVAEAFSGFLQESDELPVVKRDPDAEGKYLLNLQEANRRLLLEAGITEDHLEVTNLCTKCHPDVFFSHRETGDARGNLSAILCLK